MAVIMTINLNICRVILVILHLLRVADASYCTESYDCTKACQTTIKTYSSCWLLFSCTEYKIAYRTCADTCYRQVCCGGYEGYNCRDIDECSSWNTCSQKCVNTDGSYRCSCYSGYSLSYNGYSCTDINECTSLTYWYMHNCQHTCTNTDGSFYCSCNHGYRLQSNGYSCQDVDECSEGTAYCAHTCINIEGSYTCSCYNGYELASNGQSCIDVDECLEGTAYCAHTCINTEGSYTCSCYNGYALSSNGQSCIDVDECTEDTDNCEVRCENIVGSYKCDCDPGFLLADDGLRCHDMDECIDNNGGCSHICTNEQGSRQCSCREGFILDTDGQTCHDIDECDKEEVSGCMHSCENILGSYICHCNTGFQLETDKSSCNDVNECLTLNGGCQQVCTNTVGSFECSCHDDNELLDDGFTCQIDESKLSVFERLQIIGKLLPDGCFSLLIDQCIHGNRDNGIRLTSTSEWYTFTEQPSIYYTFGITFVEIDSMALPISLSGFQVTLSQEDCKFSFSPSATIGNSNVLANNSSNKQCQPINLTDLDIFDFLTHGSFLKTYLLTLSNSLPNWIDFYETDDSHLETDDVKSDLLYGTEIKDKEWCDGVPVLDEHLYNVLRLGTSFSVRIISEDIKLTQPPNGNTFCFVTDLSTNDAGSVFLMVPEQARNFLESFVFVKELKENYGFEILPRGIGLSVESTNRPNELELWNGDTMFQTSLDFLSPADVWVGGEISVNGNLLSIGGDIDVFLAIPNLENMLTTLFIDEWNAYGSANISPSLKFMLLGKECEINLGDFLNSQMETYASVGGEQRSLCGDDSNPPGVFFAVQLELSTGFVDVPILGDWYSSIKQRAYIYTTYESLPLPSEINIRKSISNVKNSVERIVFLIDNDLFELGLNIIFRNTTFTSIDETLHDLAALKKQTENIIDGLEVLSFNDMKLQVDQLFILLSDVEYQLILFSYETDYIVNAEFANFKNHLQDELNGLKDETTNILRNITKTLMKQATSLSGFGIKYTANLVLYTIELGEFDVEIVYSTDNLFKCSRFNKVNELLAGEEAMRVIGRAAYKKKLNKFFEYQKGIGIGVALSLRGDKFVVQVQLFASLLGLKATGDLFVTNNGIYLYIEGNIWDVFLAQLDISAEFGKKWYELVLRVEGRFVAKADKKRQIQTDRSTFESSYLDALKTLISKIANYAENRITQAQNQLTYAQSSFTDAQRWLSKKQEALNGANKAFDKAVDALESVKDTLEAAKQPYEEALERLRNAQRNVDNLCKIKTCDDVCVLPKVKCKFCFKGWFPYPCCKTTGCAISIPNPICIAANVACRVARGLAYLALEAAQVFVRLPIFAFDTAKVAVSVAQVIVDKARFTVTIAEGLLEMVTSGLELAKTFLDAAKWVLEGVKFALGAAVNVLNLVIEFGIQALIDVKNCGFNVEISTKDLPVFAVFCDINAFNLGWKTVTIKVNFKNVFQSIWNAARATIDKMMSMIGGVFGIGRKRREIAFKASAKLHTILYRNIREVGIDNTFSNESIDVSYDIIGMGNDIEEDYDSRVLLFEEKCAQMNVTIEFLQETFGQLQGIVNESMLSINEVISMIHDLEQYSSSGTADNMTLEDFEINTENAKSEYNMTDDELEQLMTNITDSIENDVLLNEASSVANVSIDSLNEMIETLESINFLDSWLVTMSNITKEFFNATQCADFKDCVLYSISILYDLYEAEDVPDINDIKAVILDLENVLIELFQNETQSISNVSIALESVTTNINYLSEANPFCSSAPIFLSTLQNQTVLNATDVVLSCNATGDPFPEFWWLKNGEYITLEQQMNITLSSVTPNDSGIYTCIAGNVVANLTSNEAHLLVVLYDDDECETRNGDCEHICINVIGSYECSCRKGYLLAKDKMTCIEKSDNGKTEEEDQVTMIAIVVTVSVVASALIVVSSVFVYMKISQSHLKIIPNEVNRASIEVIDIEENQKKPLAEGPFVDFKEHSLGPGKTGFNNHNFTSKVMAWK